PYSQFAVRRPYLDRFSPSISIQDGMPNPNGFRGARDQVIAIRQKRQAHDPGVGAPAAAMALESGHFLSCERVPDPYRTVASRHPLAVRSESDTSKAIQSPGEQLFLPGGDVPKPQRAVPTHRYGHHRAI